jgi:hypothetical protein
MNSMEQDKVKLTRTHHTDASERMCSSYSFLTSALDGVSGQRHAPAALYTRDRTPAPIGWEAGCASELVWTQRLDDKSFSSTGDRTPVAQSVGR